MQSLDFLSVSRRQVCLLTQVQHIFSVRAFDLAEFGFVSDGGG
jgi:hypothetical protein